MSDDVQAQTDAVLQQIIVDVSGAMRGRTVDEAMDALAVEIRVRGLQVPPSTWLEAVAADVVAGRTYVVSLEARDQAGVDDQATDVVQSDDGSSRSGDQPD